MTKLTPFADDAVSVSIGGLTVENGTDRVAIYGSLDLTRDKQGLAHALALKALLDAAVQQLQAEKDPPGAAPPPGAPKTVPNPFGYPSGGGKSLPPVPSQVERCSGRRKST